MLISANAVRRCICPRDLEQFGLYAGHVMKPARLCVIVWSLADYGWRLPVAAKDARPWSRTYVIETWNTDRGLFQNVVISLAQSGDGYLWLAYHHGGSPASMGCDSSITPRRTRPRWLAAAFIGCSPIPAGIFGIDCGGDWPGAEWGIPAVTRGIGICGGISGAGLGLLYFNSGSCFCTSAGGTNQSLLCGQWRDGTNLVWQTVPL